MSINTTNKRKRITIDTKVAIINAVDKQEKSNVQINAETLEIVSSAFFFIPYYRNNDNPCYNDTLRKFTEFHCIYQQLTFSMQS